MPPAADSFENIITEFIKSNWSITDPVIGSTPIITSSANQQHQTQVNKFAYDTHRTYYIRVKEAGSEVKNRQIRLNTYEFQTPMELELFSRRLKKGEAFLQINNMMNELLRIFGTCGITDTAGQLSGIGIEGVTLDRMTAMEKERPPSQNIWAKRLRITLYYYKVSLA